VPGLAAVASQQRKLMTVAAGSPECGKTLKVGTTEPRIKNRHLLHIGLQTTLKPIIYLVCITALAFVGLILGRSALGGNLNSIELLIAALAVSGVMTWRLLVRRRERQKLEGMRDSALW
jgi:hypothetical protein